MSYAIQPASDAGARVVEAAASLIEPFRSRAAAADDANAMEPENFRDIQRTGVAAAFVPEDLGGMGMRSMHDWVLTIATLARGDASAAIAISMHLSQTRGLAGVYRGAPEASPARARAKGILEAVARREVLICSTTTERGNDNLHPMTEARRTEDGWLINGQKHFVTMSPIATHVGLNLRMQDDDGWHIANVFVPMDTPGVEPQGDWNALGMRASGSQSVKFVDCLAPHDALRKIGPWGKWSTTVLVNRTLANVPLVGAFLGIAEAAFEIARTAQPADAATSRPGVPHALAEMEILLATSQGILGALGQKLDAFVADLDAGMQPTLEQGHELMKDYQSAKWVVNRNAIEIVSQAMDLAGGGGFVARNPLTRLYRDVRAGPFMQPYSPVDARDYMGKVILKAYPED